ncbi:MAG TPA: helix-turn-helix transcriptional regulator [Solirubrobacteraceae bacterium]|nr:helix-turn-helix transcriptional regulator [Solirubrobacteraceae bacterium]
MRISHQTRIVLQAFLDAPADELYGFELTKATRLKAGSLYPILQRLVSEGWLTARWEDIDQHQAGRRRRRYYRLSAKGAVNATEAVEHDSVALRGLMPGWST